MSRAASRRFIFLCGAIPAAVVAIMALYRPAFFTRLDNAVYDTLLRLSGTRPPGNRVVIVDVDERSLSTLGQWPWRRDVIGQLIAALRDQGAATIALDFVFAEPDRYEGQAAAESADDRSSDARSDALFADALSGGRVVLGYAFTFDGSPNPPSKCVLQPIGLALIHREAQDPQDLPLFQG